MQMQIIDTNNLNSGINWGKKIILNTPLQFLTRLDKRKIDTTLPQ